MPCRAMPCHRVFLISQRPELVQGRIVGAPVVLTPNARECALLATAVVGHAGASLSELARQLDGPIVFRKGPVDRICGPAGEVRRCCRCCSSVNCGACRPSSDAHLHNTHACLHTGALACGWYVAAFKWGRDASMCRLCV